MTDWVFMSKVISDTGHKTVHAVAAENPPEGDLCFLLEDSDFMVVLFLVFFFFFYTHLPLFFFEASKLQEFNFFVSFLQIFKKFWYC